MLDRLVKPKDLTELNLDERIDFIQEKINLKEEDMVLIETFKENPNYTLFDATMEVSEIIYKTMVENGYSKRYSLTHLTGSIIAPLITKEQDHRIASSLINNTILKHFKNEREELSKNYCCKVSTPTILRKTIFEEIEGKPFLLNIEESKKLYGEKIKFSDFDLLRGIKLPKIGIEEAILLGIATTAGSLDHSKTKSTHNVVFGFSKKRDDEFYTQTVQKIIENSFQIYNETTQIGKNLKRRIELSSTAIHSLFKDYLGMSEKLKDRRTINISKLPTKILKENKRTIEVAYLSGLLSGKLRINKNNAKGRPQGGINSIDNPSLLYDIQKLTDKYNIETIIVNNNTRLAFNPEAMKKIINNKFYKNKNFDYEYKGLLLNLHKIKKL